MDRFFNFIAGEELAGEVRPNVNPSDTRDVIGFFSVGTAADVDRAVDAARAAQRGWARTGAFERAAILSKAGRAIEDNLIMFAEALAREEGKTLREVR